MLGLLSPAHWNWVAIGTILLAVATFSLAVYNRKIVVASQDELRRLRGRSWRLPGSRIRTARGALEAQTAPLLARMCPRV